MTKLIIIISENIRDAGEKCIFGYEVKQKYELEEEEMPKSSMIPLLAWALPKVVLSAIEMLQDQEGAQMIATGFHPGCLSIESIMDNLENSSVNNSDCVEDESRDQHEIFPKEIE